MKDLITASAGKPFIQNIKSVLCLDHSSIELTISLWHCLTTRKLSIDITAFIWAGTPYKVVYIKKGVYGFIVIHVAGDKDRNLDVLESAPFFVRPRYQKESVQHFLHWLQK